MRRNCWFRIALVLCALSVPAAAAGEFNFVEKEDTRPAIWQSAKPQDALKAELAARTDAWAKLAEFIGGMEVKGAVSVKQLVDVNSIATGEVHARIAGMSAEKIVHYSNGMVQIAVSAKLSDLVAAVGSQLLETTVGGVAVDPAFFRSVNEDDAEGTITMWGNSALKGSSGEGVVQAVRAAELLAMEQMMAQLEGVEIERGTSVRDLVLVSDSIQTCINDSLKGIQYVDYRILDKAGIAEVDAALKFARIIQRVVEEYRTVYRKNCRGCWEPVQEAVQTCIADEETVTHSVTAKAAIG